MKSPKPTTWRSEAVKGLRGLGKTFRGEIYENASRFRLIGRAYESLPPEQDGHFCIESARHLEGPLRALKDPNVRGVIIIGATQVLKSVAGDIWIPYILEHNIRNCLILFETDPKGLLYADTRFMDNVKQHPVLSKMLGEVKRSDVTKTELKFAGCKLLIGGLNDSNVSSLSWPIIWVSEAWQHGSDGLLRKAIKRADRFPNDCKILIESQAGLADEDLHAEAKNSHPVPLTWACPLCGGRQSWAFAKLRPDDFPIPEKRGTYSGMQFNREGTIDERARSAYWECFYCCEAIRDTRINRQKIMDSYQQDYKINGPNGEKVSPKWVCFYLPKESARDNSFEESAKAYLKAKEAQAAGLLQPLIDWYLNERAEFFSNRLIQSSAQVIISSANIENTIPNEKARMMFVDCQQDPEQSALKGQSVIGHFWYVVWAVDEGGKNIYQLARGYARSWKEWIDVRKALKVPNKNVAIDGGRWLDDVLDAAANNWELGRTFKQGRTMKREISLWTILRGNGMRRSFRHEDGVYRVFAPASIYHRPASIDGKERMLNLNVMEWSNLSVKDQLFSIRQGGPGKPVLHILPREKLNLVTQQKETGDFTYQRQVSNEYRTRKNNRDIWLESNPQVHYNDCDCMGIVLCARGGLIGHIEAQHEETETV